MLLDIIILYIRHLTFIIRNIKAYFLYLILSYNF